MLKKKFKNKKVLITGHSGFKGTWLSLICNILGAEFIGISKYNINNKPFHNSVKKINNRFFFYEHFLSLFKNDYIFIPKNNFFAFYGLSIKEAVILNLAFFPHYKNKTIEKKINFFNYK